MPIPHLVRRLRHTRVRPADALLLAVMAAAAVTALGAARAVAARAGPAMAGGTGSAGPGRGGSAAPLADVTGGSPSAHEASQGFILSSAAAPDRQDADCGGSLPLRIYDVDAVNVDITLNRYFDHDPKGLMYVLDSGLGRVREEVTRNAAARLGHGDPAGPTGLQGDAIQPLTLRVHQGECLRITLHNQLTHGEPASIHLHGSGLHVVDGGGPAIATNPRATVRPGESVTYEWRVGPDEPEGTHYFHSHGDDRFQTDHGLFGAVIVEPRDSRWIDPLTGSEAATGWAAMIDTGGRSFREFVLYYHEIGSESYQLLDRTGAFVPLVDPTTHAYRPDARALNYRSEPFMNRLLLQQARAGRLDESLEYSSYAFGDPATPVMRSYLGDPIKQRVVHAGAEVLHVHHVHGGGTRWLRQPGTQAAAPESTLDKHPPLHPQLSERADSQSMGPSETFDVVDECGSGGCQQSAGDFMYHCHVTQHYFAGMWSIWRVYNTRQTGAASTDVLPPLRELPSRSGRTAPAITSTGLLGHRLPAGSGDVTLDPGGLAAWVEPQLPPAGIPRGGDASVLDWRRQGDLYIGEPETGEAWPGYRSPSPGQRRPLLFDPRTGRLAYPLLSPHLNRRPPFAPGHGPGPFLDPYGGGTEPPPPGANGPASDCPAGSRPDPVAINAITVPVNLSLRENLVDPFGQLFVRREEEDAVRADPSRRTPLAIRANAGEDCLDVLLRSELDDNPGDPVSKVGMHIHLVQFDVQASDGVDTGFNYEQTVRPFRSEGVPLASAVPAGATSVPLAGAERFQPGILLGIGLDQGPTFEAVRVAGAGPGGLTLAGPLQHPHGAGEIAGTEFVRYRWYPDAQTGTSFFHDHVNVLESGRHGLYGAMVTEPPGSTYHDPRTGEPVTSGPIADVHTAARASLDVAGSFREALLLLQDDNPITHIGRSTGSSINLRVDPPEGRSSRPSRRFSSDSGDPETPLVEANLGDPVVLRTLVGASNDVHTLHVDGHWFRTEPYSPTSPPTSTVDIGISERRDVFIPRAGGPQGMPGDYLYYSGRSVKLQEGSWGLLRVLGPGEGGGLQPLPGHQQPPPPAAGVCPPAAPRRRFDVAAVEVPLPMLGGRLGKIFVLASDRDALTSGRLPPRPLVLHVDVGDCLLVHLTNATRQGPVSFHADLLAADPRTSGGVATGRDPDQSITSGQARDYTLYASPEVGETTALVRDWGDVLRNPGLGLYGAIVVGPKGATYSDPLSGADVSGGSDWQVVVHSPGAPDRRDTSLFLQDEDAGIGNHRMPYTEAVEGTVGLNYTSEPLARRLDRNADTSSIFRRDTHGDPATPLIEAYPGDPLTLHVLLPWSEQAQVFSIEGHRWRIEPRRPGSNLVSSVHLGGMEALTLSLEGGAASPADYVYGDHRGPYLEAGLWGLLRVHAQCDDPGVTLRPLDRGCPPPGWSPLRVASTIGVGAAAVLSLLWGASSLRRRRLLRQVT